MSWRLLFGGPLKNEEKDITSENGDVSMEASAPQGTVSDDDETYQKKLFENDLYVWSLLLFRRDDL